jgi:hypothetical protein
VAVAAYAKSDFLIPGNRRGKEAGPGLFTWMFRRPSGFFFLDIYGKEEKDDLKAAEKKVLKRPATEFKNLAKQTVKKDDSS